MKRIAILVLALGLSLGAGHAQQMDSIRLDEVVLSDSKLAVFSEGFHTQTLSDATRQRSGARLTELLRNNSSIYFRENGPGMVASASFRGTAAQHTAVIWNGININSQLNGQTDFNTVNANAYDAVKVRSGGGSVQYGSGAIGGSVHLEDRFAFDTHFTNQLQLGYGSFNSQEADYTIAYGKERLSVGGRVNYLHSDNDFKYLGTDQYNENGVFGNVGVNVHGGYKLSDAHYIKLYHNSFIGEREFSGTLTAPSRSKYRNRNFRTLLEWGQFWGQATGKLKGAMLYERYQYYADKASDAYSFGEARTFLVQYDYKYHWEAWTLDAVAEYNTVKGEGSDLDNAQRNTLAVTTMAAYKPNTQWGFGLNMRKEYVNDFDSPFLFGADGRYHISPEYALYANASKNYRIPSFNDLYWQGVQESGNPALIPETSHQGELGQEVEWGNAHIIVAGFYISVDDMIQWRPNSSGNWFPINVDQVEQYGLEVKGDYQTQLGNHHLVLDVHYGWTKSINTETGNQLMYVPLHQFTGVLTDGFKAWTAFCRLRYTSSVYTTTDQSESLDGYALTDLGLARSFDWENGLTLEGGVQARNIFNVSYQNMAYRPMPGFNIQIQLLFKI